MQGLRYVYIYGLVLVRTVESVFHILYVLLSINGFHYARLFAMQDESARIFILSMYEPHARDVVCEVCIA